MKDLTQEAQLQIERELTESLLKLSDSIGSCDTPSIGFDKSVNHFKGEFRRIKKEQYYRIERDREAQLIMVNEVDKRDKEIAELKQINNGLNAYITQLKQR